MKSDEYLRVGNNYYKKVQPPSTTDDKTTILKKWSDAGILKKRYLGESVFYLRSEIMAAIQEYK